MTCCGEKIDAVRQVLMEPKDPDQVALRRGICEECPILQVHYGASFCGTPLRGSQFDPMGCGCWLNVKWRIATAECPRSQWGPVSDRLRALGAI